MAGLNGDVGPNSVNNQADVAAVQTHLTRHAAWLASMQPPAVTGQFDSTTAAAIILFQKNAASFLNPDGVVSHNGFTIRRLEMLSIPQLQASVFRAGPFPHTSGLSDADFATAAAVLGVQPAAAKAVSQVETKRSAWDELGRPSILFERHRFSHWTNGAYSTSHPDICNSTSGGYGKFAEQYVKLRRAAVLDETAALMSASWGAFQIMGENHIAAGYQTVMAFVQAVLEDEKNHLDAFVAFIKGNSVMHQALKDHDWDSFALRYNGPSYLENDYANKMRQSFKELGGV
jgi:hypothetical protein